MITIDLLRNRPEMVPQVTKLWYEGFSTIWQPTLSLAEVTAVYLDEVKSDGLPVTFIALDDGKPVGMCSLSANDGIRPDLSPWLASAFVDKAYRSAGVGKQLVMAVLTEARVRCFPSLYLYTFEQPLADYYARFGFCQIAVDTYDYRDVIVMQALLSMDEKNNRD